MEVLASHMCLCTHQRFLRRHRQISSEYLAIVPRHRNLPPYHEGAHRSLRFHSRRTQARSQSPPEYARRTEFPFFCASDYHAHAWHKSALLQTSPTISLTIITQSTETVCGFDARLTSEVGYLMSGAFRCRHGTNAFTWSASY